MVAALLFALRKILLQMVVSWGGKEFLEWALFKLAEMLVKHTDTKVDDEWFDKMKTAYFAVENKDKDTK